MAVQFDVDTGKARIELSRLMQMVSKIGSTLEAAEATSESALSSMEQSLSTATFAASEAVNKFKALSSGVGDLNQVLRTADVLNRYSKMILDLNAAMDQSTINATKLANATKLTNEGYRTAELVAKERLKTAEAGATAEVRSEEAFRRSAIALEQLATITGRLAAIEAQRVKGAEAIVIEKQKQADATALHAKQIELLNTAEGREAAASKVRYDSAVKMAAAEARQAASIAETAQAINLLKNPEGQRLAQMQATLRAEQQAAAEMAAHAAEAEKLRREIAFLQTEEGQRLTQLRAEAAAERAAATASAEASVTRNAGLRVGNQLTSSLRAGLMGLRTSIGMYTSSTIVAAAATFGIARAIRSGIEAGADFTAAMARTQAVMGSTGAETAALEAQVRAIGASSQFTATEVAKASTELGLIGLTAGQALIALRPVLNLATIGDMTVAESAKLATDAMLIFGKTVDDMAHITDIYAIAAAQSSATVEELATAMSYAGPAAHALGISMEDTTAAIEALSNAGIRGSRAGTALRLMFDRLADPSGKGIKAMKDLGISIEDIRGEAMNLGDILEMLKGKLSNLSGVEQVAKLGDIFGVRQASAVANLLANIDNYSKARVQLELAQGAADKMVQDLRDAASFDWKNLVAAFQSLQITVFKNNEYAIRSFIERLRAFVLYLTDDVGGGVTRFELYATRIIRVGEALALVYGTAKLISFTRGLMDTTLRLKEQSDAYLMVAAGATKARMAAMGYSEAAIAAAMPKPAPIRTSVGAASAVAGEGAAVGGAAGSLLFARSFGTGLLAIGSKVLGVLGWIGVAVGVATTLYQLYRTFTDAGVPKNADEQAAKAAELKATYDAFKKDAESRTQVQSIDIMEKAQKVQVDNTAEIKNNIEQLQARKEAMLSVAKTEQDRANVESLFNALLEDQQTKLANATKAADDMANALQRMREHKVTPDSVISGELAKQIDDARKALDEAMSKRDYAYRLFGSQAEQDAANANLKKARDNLANILDIFKQFKETGSADGLNTPLKDFLQQFDLKEALNQQSLTEGSQNKNQILADNLADASRALDTARTAASEARQKVVDMDKALSSAAVTSQAMTKARQEATLALNTEKNAIEDYNKALSKTQAMEDQIADYERKHKFNQLTPAQRKAYYANQKSTAQGIIDQIGGANVKPEDLARLLQAEKDRNEAEDALGNNSKSAAPSGDDNFIQKLREQLDPINAAAKKLADEKTRLLKTFTGSEGERNLLLGQLEYNQLKTSLEFSTGSLEDQIAAIDKWKTAQLAAAKTEGQRLQIEREAHALSSQRINDLQGEKRAVEDYGNSLKDQELALQQQMDDRIAALGVGSQEAQQQSALTKLQRDYNSESSKLLRDHNRALDGLDAKYDEDKIKRENRRYEQEKAALFVDFQEKIAITKQGYEDLLKAQGNVQLGIKGGLSQVIEDGTNIAGKMQQAVVGGFNDMTDAVVNFAKTSKFSLKEFAVNFAEMMLRMELAALEAKLAMAILGLFAPSGAASSAGTFSIGTPGSQYGSYNLGFAQGGVFDHGTVTAMAKGGLINRPTLFPMATGGIALGGEAGTEAIMPLKRMGSGDLGVRVESAGGGDTYNFQTNVNVNSDGSSTSTSTSDDSQAGRQLSKMIEAKTKEIIVRATQPGGILWKQRNGVTV